MSNINRSADSEALVFRHLISWIHACIFLSGIISGAHHYYSICAHTNIAKFQCITGSGTSVRGEMSCYFTKWSDLRFAPRCSLIDVGVNTLLETIWATKPSTISRNPGFMLSIILLHLLYFYGFALWDDSYSFLYE